MPLTVGININFVGLFQGDVSNFLQIGADSSQWWSGMGVAVIFGLAFATVLTLIVVPVCYDLLGKKELATEYALEEGVEPIQVENEEDDIEFDSGLNPAKA